MESTIEIEKEEEVVSQRVRFSGAPWFGVEDYPVIIGGTGGIGSWVSTLLSRIGFELYLYDFDSVEEHNIGGQLFKNSDIGKKKTEAISDVIKEFSDHSVAETHEKYTKDSMSGPIVISCFDNMEARKTMFDNWTKYAQNEYNAEEDGCPCIFIDGRLLAEQLQVFCITRDEKRIKSYREDYLFNDNEVEDAECSYKQTSHCASMIASFMVSFLTNSIANFKENNTIREVPFSLEYYIPLNYFESRKEV